MCCSPWGHKESDTDERLILTESLEGVMLKLKLQFFWPPYAKANSQEKTLMLGSIEDQEEKDDRE